MLNAVSSRAYALLRRLVALGLATVLAGGGLDAVAGQAAQAAALADSWSGVLVGQSDTNLAYTGGHFARRVDTGTFRVVAAGALEGGTVGFAGAFEAYAYDVSTSYTEVDPGSICANGSSFTEHELGSASGTVGASPDDGIHVMVRDADKHLSVTPEAANPYYPTTLTTSCDGASPASHFRFASIWTDDGYPGDVGYPPFYEIDGSVKSSARLQLPQTDSSGKVVGTTIATITIHLTRQPDADGDGIPDSKDTCVSDFGTMDNGCPTPVDGDGDGVPDTSDNCPGTPNANQANLDGDTAGDACDPDIDGDGTANSADGCPLVPGRLDTGCPNRPPVAVDDDTQLVPNTTTRLALLANDTDADGDPLSITSFTQPSCGTVGAIRFAGQVVAVDYRVGATGCDGTGFDYTVSDGHGGTDVGRVTVEAAQCTGHATTATMSARPNGRLRFVPNVHTSDILQLEFGVGWCSTGTRAIVRSKAAVTSYANVTGTFFQGVLAHGGFIFQTTPVTNTIKTSGAYTLVQSSTDFKACFNTSDFIRGELFTLLTLGVGEVTYTVITREVLADAEAAGWTEEQQVDELLRRVMESKKVAIEWLLGSVVPGPILRRITASEGLMDNVIEGVTEILKEFGFKAADYENILHFPSPQLCVTTLHAQVSALLLPNGHAQVTTRVTDSPFWDVRTRP